MRNSQMFPAVFFYAVKFQAVEPGSGRKVLTRKVPTRKALKDWDRKDYVQLEKYLEAKMGLGSNVTIISVAER